MPTVVVSDAELRSLLKDELAEALSKFRPTPLNGALDDQLLKRTDLAKMFDVSLVTIHAWMKAGHIPYHRVGGRTYFKKEEVLESLKKIRLRKK